MATKSMQERFRRAKALARRKLIAELEKEARQVSDSDPKDDGKGSAGAKGTADSDRNPGKELKRVKPTKRDKNTKKRKEDITKKPKKVQKQKAIDEADDVREELTSDMPELESTPKPKLTSKSSDSGKKKQFKKELSDATKKREELTSDTPKQMSTAARRAWRREKIAELKQALTQEEFDSLDSEELSDKDLGQPLSKDQAGKVQNKASDAQRKPAFKVYQVAKAKVPELFGKAGASIAKANDQLEDAIMSSDLRQIKAALAMVMTQVQKATKERMGEMVQLGKAIRGAMATLTPKQASTAKYASALSKYADTVRDFEDELARSRVLIRMASKSIEFRV